MYVKTSLFLLLIAVLNKYYTKANLGKEIDKSVSTLKQAIKDVVKHK